METEEKKKIYEEGELIECVLKPSKNEKSKLISYAPDGRVILFDNPEELVYDDSRDIIGYKAVGIVSYANDRYYKVIVNDVLPPEEHKAVQINPKKHRSKYVFYVKVHGKMHKLRLNGTVFYNDLRHFVEDEINGSEQTQ